VQKTETLKLYYLVLNAYLFSYMYFSP
jgi:hypothetical protein